MLGHQDENLIVVYQAYKSSIADFAVNNQYLGGSDYSYSRMSWIKPNFLWMMYRCGWAEKENQERVLAFWVDKTDFENILKEAVLSSFDQKYYDNYDHWKSELNSKEVRLQWDPDHDPFGNKVERRAVQLGLRGKMLKKFGRQQIKRVENITDFVKQQKQLLDGNQMDKLLVPVETIFRMVDNKQNERIGIE
ncbi:MAG: DUF4291 domain-containing protein [Panacibacter sp.]